MPPTTGTPTTATTGERADLLETLAKHGYFLRLTVRDISDEEAGRRTTASALCLGGLIKHVAGTESNWVDFILGGPEAMMQSTAGSTPEDWTAQFQMRPEDTLSGVLERYEAVARRTDELVATLPDLDLSHPLPPAPWFEPGARWSARRVLLHIIARPPSTPVTPTSSASPSTARRAWADGFVRLGLTGRTPDVSSGDR